MGAPFGSGLFFGVAVGLCASVSLWMIIHSTWCWLGIRTPRTCSPSISNPPDLINALGGRAWLNAELRGV